MHGRIEDLEKDRAQLNGERQRLQEDLEEVQERLTAGHSPIIPRLHTCMVHCRFPAGLNSHNNVDSMLLPYCFVPVIRPVPASCLRLMLPSGPVSMALSLAVATVAPHFMQLPQAHATTERWYQYNRQ